MRSIPRALVLIPTHDHGPALRWSTASALEQSVADLEVAIVGDGMTDETREVARELSRHHDRVRLHDFPKGASRGELHRHRILGETEAPVVCYLADDDLWLGDHVETMLGLLEDSDFASVPALVVEPGGGTARVWFTDLASPFGRDRQVGGGNRVPLSCAAHTLAMYRRLPHGWRVTAQGVPTDLYMWQQILGQAELRATSGYLPTVVNFPAPLRPDWSGVERAAELEEWASRLRAGPEPVLRRSLRFAMRELTRQETGMQWLLDKRDELERDAADAVREHEDAVQCHEDAVRGREAAAREEHEDAAREREQAAREHEELREAVRQATERAHASEQLLARFAGTLTWRLRETLFRLPWLGRLLHRMRGGGG